MMLRVVAFFQITMVFCGTGQYLFAISCYLIDKSSLNRFSYNSPEYLVRAVMMEKQS